MLRDGRSRDRIEYDLPYISRYVLLPGTFPFRVEHPGYEPVEMSATIEPGRVTEINTLLFPKRQ